MPTEAIGLRRELRDLLELVLIPGTVALLPWALGFRVLRFISRHSWPYRGLGDDALAQIMAVQPPPDPQTWRGEYRLTQIVELTDYWLSSLRSDRWLERHLRVEGEWPERGPFIALGFVWGNAGFWCLRQLGAAGLKRALVYRPVEAEERDSGWVRYHYFRARMRHFHRAAGGPGVPTGGAWERIQELFREQHAIVVVADAPPLGAHSTLDIRLLGRPAQFRTGILRLVVESGVPVVMYSVRLDRDTGQRILRVQEPIQPRDVEQLAAAAAGQLDRLLREDSAGWAYWTGADGFFVDVDPP